MRWKLFSQKHQSSSLALSVCRVQLAVLHKVLGLPVVAIVTVVRARLYTCVISAALGLGFAATMKVCSWSGMFITRKVARQFDTRITGKLQLN